MEFKKKEIEEICDLFNNVGDISALDYLGKLNLKDKKARRMLNNMIELNCKMLESNIYIDYRKEFLNYLGFDFDYNNELMYIKDFQIKTDKDKFLNEVVQKYDEYLMLKEKRGVSYGELAYIQNLGKRELKELYNAIIEELESKEVKNE